jgi:hypothetical protein
MSHPPYAQSLAAIRRAHHPQSQRLWIKRSRTGKVPASLSDKGKRRRTFNHRGRAILMARHLKHGVKESPAETLRIHFEWLADDKKITIGHCGKHLDF